MSSIQNITNLQSPRLLSRQNNFASTQSFKGAPKSDAEKELAKKSIEVAQETVNNMKGGSGKFLRGIMKLSGTLQDHAGEMENQIINAIFTATLAPFFIAFNPISKQDKKTKEYSALRQPISAGIAISGGVAMTMAINRFMNNLCYKGHLKTTDGRINPDSSYFKADFEKGLKAQGDDIEKQKTYLEKFEPIIAEENKTNKKGAISKKYIKASLDAYTEDRQKERQELFSALMGEHPDSIKFDKAKGEILVNGKNFSPVVNLQSEAELTDYLKKKNIHNVTFSDFMKKNFDFKYNKTEGAEKAKLNASSFNHLSEIKAMDFLNKLGIVGEETQIEGMEKVSGKDLGKLLLGTDKDISEMKLDKLFEELGFITKNDPNKTNKANLEIRMNDLQNKFEAEGKETKLSKILGDFETKISKTKLPNFKADAKKLDFVSNIVKKQAKNLGTEFKCTKGYVGIITNLFTTAITCTVLNWAYPRIVAKFFPGLAKTDTPAKAPTQKGGNK